MPLSALQMGPVGGGIVRRGFHIGKRFLQAGTNLTAAEITSIPMVNRQALVNTGKLDLYPMPAGATKHIVSSGFGKFDVIQGIKLNTEPLTKEQALAIAAGAPAADEKPAAAPAPAEPKVEAPAAAPPSPKQTRAKAQSGKKQKRKVKASPPH